MSDVPRSILALAALLVALLACADSGDHQDFRIDGEPWAEPAVELFDSLAAAYNADDEFAVANLLTAGGSLEMRVLSARVLTDPLEIAAKLREEAFAFRAREPGIALDVGAPQVFLIPDGAIVRYDGYGGTHGRLVSWAQLYRIGPDSKVTSRIYLSAYPNDPTFGVIRPGYLDVYERYIEAWSNHDSDALREIYRDDAVIRDGISGREWSGHDEIGELLAVAPPTQAGPHPRFFTFFGNDLDLGEVIVLVQTGGDCPMLEARRLVVDRNIRILRETRYAHVPSVRRCIDPDAEGWWTGFEPPPPTDRFVDQLRVVEGSMVDLVNAEPGQIRFSEWLLGRFAVGGLPIPEVAAIWYPPSLDCPDQGSRAREVDGRYDGGHTITLCLIVGGLVPDTLTTTWSARAARDGLHELGHVWMYDELADEVRDEFVTRAGVAAWRAADLTWGELGVEHAAETLAWGLADAGQAMYLIEPVPECEELAARFELLTGMSPITRCPGSGGAP